jgi:hypothetical protein
MERTETYWRLPFDEQTTRAGARRGAAARHQEITKHAAKPTKENSLYTVLPGDEPWIRTATTTSPGDDNPEGGLVLNRGPEFWKELVEKEREQEWKETDGSAK